MNHVADCNAQYRQTCGYCFMFKTAFTHTASLYEFITVANANQLHIMLLGRERSARGLPFSCNFSQASPHGLLKRCFVRNYNAAFPVEIDLGGVPGLTCSFGKQWSKKGTVAQPNCMHAYRQIEVISGLQLRCSTALSSDALRYPSLFCWLYSKPLVLRFST